MNTKSHHAASATIQVRAGRLLQSIAPQPSRDVEQARLAFLVERFGLPPTRATVIATLYFGEPRQ